MSRKGCLQFTVISGSCVARRPSPADVDVRLCEPRLGLFPPRFSKSQAGEVEERHDHIRVMR
ncbi:MAG: hypothetical protein WCJ55_19830 [Chloroflexales bacterium]